MKGMVFTEFMDMIDTKFGPALTERIIDATPLADGGAYSAIGTYDHRELLGLVANLSRETGIAVPQLVQTFGQHLFGRFLDLYPVFFEGVGSMFEFLEQVDDHVHIEVLKLYPDAELPHFVVEPVDESRMGFVYESTRPLADLAEGLIRGCAEHFGDTVEIQRETISTQSGSAVRFLITRIA